MSRAKPDPRRRQALRIMRALLAIGITDEGTLVAEAAAAIDMPGTTGAREVAQAVFDRNMKIMGEL